MSAKEQGTKEEMLKVEKRRKAADRRVSSILDYQLLNYAETDRRSGRDRRNGKDRRVK
jgi:hypothetical protein